MRKGRLLLSSIVRGKLRPDEFRPLLAASLIYDSRFRWKRWIGGLVFLGVSGSLIASFYWLFVFFWFPNCTSCFGGSVLVYPPILIIIVFVAIMGPYFRRIKLQADRCAVEKLGIRTELTEVLRKIDDVSSHGLRAKSWGHLSWSPMIAQRIRNISP